MLQLWDILRGELPPHQVPFLAEDRPDGERRRHLALVLAYRGEGFAGWQLQPRARTLQGELETVLSRLCDQPVRLVASGRTDAGVHALGQVAHFSTTSRLSLERMSRGIRSLLPEGVHLRKLGPVAPEFHARYQARAKTYLYYLRPGGGPRLFLQGHAWCLETELNPEPVRRALELLPGERDLAALASHGYEGKGGTSRRIFQAGLELEPGGLWRVQITADGFLRHAVRNLVGILSQVGSGRLAPEDLMEMLVAGRRLHAGPKAPPQGLYLARVYYRDYPQRP